MKKIAAFGCICILLTFSLFAEEVSENGSPNDVAPSTEEEETVEQSVIPAARRPQKPSPDQLETAVVADENRNTDEYVQKCVDTFKYGLETEISDLIDELTNNGDMRFVDEIYDLFQVTKDPAIKQKVLAYFGKLKDPCLEDFAVTVIDDPYDEKKDTVRSCFTYVSAVDCKEAIPGLIKLIDKEDEDFFDGALSCIGEIGGSKEATFLASYIDRDDLTVAQKQSLMKVLGKIKAIETWDKLSEIAQDDNENSFVRMYAAEAIGAMEKPESEPILLKLYESDDPNFRVYIIKGISHFHDKDADNLIIQALRDSQYKVRFEAVGAVRDRKMVEAVPYLIYRCKDTTEQTNVKDECYKVIALLNTKEGNEYLVSLITNKKLGDSTKAKVAAALLENNNAGTEEILVLAEDTLKSDSKKSLRYALGKEFAKYGRPEYAQVCADYLASKDVATQGTGLDIFAKGKYGTVRSQVEQISKDDEESAAAANEAAVAANKTQFGKKKANANAKKAKRILEQIDSLGGTAATTAVPEK